jgi:DnaK suppressor protein
MTKAELDTFRRRLLALKKRLGGDLNALEEEALRPAGGEAAGGLSDVPVHPADLGSDTFEEELALELLENEAQILVEINDAPARIEQGTFGTCENCHRRISKERLEAMPYARYCIRCARKLQGSSASGRRHRVSPATRPGPFSTSLHRGGNSRERIHGKPARD